jgi:NADH-dependent peroxiredoxin subunit C
MIDIGQLVPEFSLEAFQAENITKLSLSDYRGKWLVLLCYPADFTFVCPTELGEAGGRYTEFQALNAEIISISTDTVYAHKAWHDTSPIIQSIDYPMAADPTGKVCRMLGTYIEDEGVSLRATFIIDPDGVLKAIDIHDNSIGRSVDEILRKLQASQFVRENHGEVCPASWRPGSKTLKPGLDLVGKI